MGRGTQRHLLTNFELSLTESLINVRAQPFFDGLELGNTLSAYYVMASFQEIS